MKKVINEVQFVLEKGQFNIVLFQEKKQWLETRDGWKFKYQGYNFFTVNNKALKEYPAGWVCYHFETGFCIPLYCGFTAPTISKLLNSIIWTFKEKPIIDMGGAKVKFSKAELKRCIQWSKEEITSFYPVNK